MGEQTAISDEDIKPFLQTLSTMKHKILEKDPANPKEWNGSDRFTFNGRFTDKRRRINIPLTVMKTTDADRAATKRVVDEDRKHAIEASIVRVMKTRKTLDYTHLIQETSAQLMRLFQ